MWWAGEEQQGDAGQATQDRLEENQDQQQVQAELDWAMP